MHNKSTIFICYGKKDADYAHKLYEDLRVHDFDPWINDKSIIPGQNWKCAIGNAIKNCRFFIALLSSHSLNQKGYMQKELQEALSISGEYPPLDTFIIPVRIDDCELDDNLSKLHRVDLFPDWEIGVQKLLKLFKEYIHEIKDFQSSFESDSGIEQQNTVSDLDPCGNVDAYSDRFYLKHCFLKTNYYIDMLDINRNFLAGKRGSGKSACAIMLSENDRLYHYKTTLQTDHDIYALFVSTLSKYKEEVFRNVWSFISERYLFKKIWRHLILISAMKTVVPLNSSYRETSKNRKTVYEFLFDNDYYTLTSWKIFSQLITEMGEAILSRDPRDHKIKYLIYEIANTLFLNKRFLSAEKSLLSILKEEKKQCLVVIDALIDNLFFRDSKDMSLRCIEGLLDACMEMTPQIYSPSLHIKCCIPGEALSFINFYEISKLRQRTVAIHWSPKDLFKIICKRIHFYASQKGDSTPKNIEWNDCKDISSKIWTIYFPEYVENQLGHTELSFFYICRHSHHYPREIITTVNHMLRHIFRDNKELRSEDIARLVHHTCDNSVEEFLQRIRNLVGRFIDELLQQFSECSKLLSHSELVQIIRNSRDIIRKYEWQEKEVITFLIRIGFLGVVDNFECESDITYNCKFAYLTGSEVPYTTNSIFAVHPMFYQYYKIGISGSRYVYPTTYMSDDLLISICE
jgi:hypothetical protein